MSNPAGSEAVEQLLDSQNLAAVLEGDRFRQFLDQAPVAVAVATLQPEEHVVYANREFERLSGLEMAHIVGAGWDGLGDVTAVLSGAPPLGQAILQGEGHLGCFDVRRDGGDIRVDAWSSIIEEEPGEPRFRLVALIATPARDPSMIDLLEQQLRDKDVQLKELQHRVRNNLQMITSLIRVEARGVTDLSTGEGYDRLAGRVEALGLLYRALGEDPQDKVVDLGIYLSEIATAVMRAHAVEGIHLDLQVDTWLVSVDVAMPTGLVVNELLTNALKHAFEGRKGGSVTLHCHKTPGGGCRVLVADDGRGLPLDYVWPKPGKLSALIVHSLLQNASARMQVTSAPEKGMRVEIVFETANPGQPT